MMSEITRHNAPSESHYTARKMSISVLILLIPVTTAVTTLTDGEMELLLVHGVWRHGDRLPLQICPTDPIQEDDWELGGGGFGQLTPLGMAQHLKFGKLLREFYVETGFLSKKYSSKEIYILSTDVNRTIISAMSNMLGMYGQPDGSSRAEVDYPNATGWPVGYVPIPVHTIDFNTNQVGNPEAKCDRMSILYNMAKNSRDVQTFLQRPDVVDLFNMLTRHCGKTIDIENLCTKCNWIKSLKYFVYSAHDTTVYALLAAMGIAKKVIRSGGYPPYTSAVFVELWMNQTDNQPYFKLMYHKDEQSDTIFRNFAVSTKPGESMEKWCNMDPRMQGKSSTSSWTLSTTDRSGSNFSSSERWMDHKLTARDRINQQRWSYCRGFG
ncbi:hypothetical protein Angca_003596 [Angiostrongylus cantonensis]|nr:hypothetical protein Angca_003596 [Angiostrongylus cantonensis]